MSSPGDRKAFMAEGLSAADIAELQRSGPGFIVQHGSSGVLIHAAYLKTLTLLERVARRHHLEIEAELDLKGRTDLNAAQALLLYNIGDQIVTPSQLRTRGYYQGCNVSYNLTKLIDNGLLQAEASRTDRRVRFISLTLAGKAARKLLVDLFERHIGAMEPVAGVTAAELQAANATLRKIESLWHGLIP